jgi:HSP20 family protein
MEKSMKDVAPYSGSTLSRLFGDRRFDRVTSQVENLFNEMLDLMPSWDSRVFCDIQPKGTFPKVNVSETDTAFDVEIAVAGFEKEDVSLELKENTLFIRAEKKEESEESDEDKKYLMKEIAHRSFQRVLRFPVKVNVESVDCSYKNGIINCKIDKDDSVKPDVVKIDIN